CRQRAVDDAHVGLLALNRSDQVGNALGLGGHVDIRALQREPDTGTGRSVARADDDLRSAAKARIVLAHAAVPLASSSSFSLNPLLNRAVPHPPFERQAAPRVHAMVEKTCGS